MKTCPFGGQENTSLDVNQCACMLCPSFLGEKKSALRNTVLEIAGVRSRPVLLLHAV